MPKKKKIKKPKAKKPTKKQVKKPGTAKRKKKVLKSTKSRAVSRVRLKLAKKKLTKPKKKISKLKKKIAKPKKKIAKKVKLKKKIKSPTPKKKVKLKAIKKKRKLRPRPISKKVSLVRRIKKKIVRPKQKKPKIILKKQKKPKKIVASKPKEIVKKETVRTKTITEQPVVFDETIHKTKIRMIGIGGGGSTIVSEIASRIKEADFYVANTDSQDLRKSVRNAKRFQFGQELTRGLGTGMSAELGEAAAQLDKERIKKLLEGQDLCIIIASLGGGTSSGAAPVFAKISKNLGNITYGIFTLPFEFEGEKKMEIAKEALEKIKPNLNVYTVIPNERIFQIIEKNAPLKDALSAINKRLADNLEGLIEMIYLPGLINIDFADLRTILAGRGRLTYLNTIEVEELNREEAIKKLISSPLYPYSVRVSRGILYNITSGTNILLSEVHQISKGISESVNKNAKIIFGISQNSKYQNKTKITLLATGCAAKGFLIISKPFSSVKKINKPSPSRKKITRSVVPKRKKKKLAKPKSKTQKIASSVKKTKTKIKSQKKKPPKKKSIKIKKGKSKILKVRKKSSPLKIKSSKSSLKISKKPQTLPVLTPKFASQSQKQTLLGVSGKIRKNALQVKKEAEQAEKEILEQEKVWEIPAIFRRRKQ